ncbi:hypothetical protein XELAEV_18029516mg [Xenopus laevis]|uniref:Uncharacterized protein n=1 Tax=Xenopus laevis TaxID=8355 RepID=A0A974CTH9_XENLA|nr:hypothetical protein XELAEV_18029516mg [Xenopus laevis]
MHIPLGNLKCLVLITKTAQITQEIHIYPLGLAGTCEVGVQKSHFLFCVFSAATKTLCVPKLQHILNLMALVLYGF